MSCFVMSNESIRTLGYTLESVFNAARFSNTITITSCAMNDSIYEAFNDCTKCYCFEGELIANELYRINVEAYAGRYEKPTELIRITGNNGNSIFEQPVIIDHNERPQDWHYKLTSLLDCWIYQTCEDVTYKDPKRIALEEFSRNLKCSIVQHSIQYNNHRWFNF